MVVFFDCLAQYSVLALARYHEQHLELNVFVRFQQR